MSAIPTVLVLDDDPGVRSTMGRLLEVYGYGAVTAATLDEAQLLESRRHRRDDPRRGAGGRGHRARSHDAIRARPGYGKAPILIFTGGVLTDQEEMLITRHRAFLFHKPEGFDTLVKFLDTLTGRDRPD